MTPQVCSWSPCPRKWKHVPQNDLYGNVHGSFIYNKHKLKMAQVFINAGMNKQTVLQVYSRIVARNKEAWSAEGCDNTGTSEKKEAAMKIRNASQRRHTRERKPSIVYKRNSRASETNLIREKISEQLMSLELEGGEQGLILTRRKRKLPRVVLMFCF